MEDKNLSENEYSDSAALGDMMGMEAAEKAKDFKTSFKKLIVYLKSHLKYIITAIILAAIGAVLVMLSPTFLSQMTDLLYNSIKQMLETGVFPGIDLRQVTFLGALLIALYAGNALFSMLQGFIMASVTQKLTKRMRTDLNEKLNRLPIHFYNRNTTGDIISRITNDADSVGQNLNNSAGMLITSLAMLTLSIIMMFITNWIMALTAIGATIIGLSANLIIMSKSQKYFVKQQKSLGKLNGNIEEYYSGHTVVKACNGEEETRAKFIKNNNELKNSAYKAQFMSALMMPIMTFVDNFGYVAICVVGAVLAAKGLISFGVIVAFIMYVRYFTQPLTQIAQAMQGLQTATAASERVFEFLEAEEMTDESAKIERIENVKGVVEFKNVKFGYEDTDKIVINNFSAIAKPGHKIAIVGPTGAGKTTLVNLLMRFNEIQSGDILIDGKSIYSVPRENVRDLFCMVLQDAWLFQGTIRENIVYNKQGVTDEQLFNACKAVGLHHFIRTLPNSYDTPLNDAVNLSEGQKQQITIARAMIQNAPMLILDEATSNVDTRTEVHIQRAMDSLMSGRTSFVIAHRLSTIKNADQILVLKDGDIVESGNHSDLLNKKGFYFDLYNSQFEKA